MRKRYYLSFDIEDPRHREAEKLFVEQGSRQRTDFVVSSILAANQVERLEQLVRQAIREELKNIRLPESSQPSDTVHLDEIPDSLLHALEEL